MADNVEDNVANNNNNNNNSSSSGIGRRGDARFGRWNRESEEVTGAMTKSVGREADRDKDLVGEGTNSNNNNNNNNNNNRSGIGGRDDEGIGR